MTTRDETWLYRHPGQALPVRTGRVCGFCEVNIDHRDIRTKFCSPRCRDLGYTGSAMGARRECLWCSAGFVASKNPQVYCSPTCRAKSDVERNRDEYNRRGHERRARERGARTTERFTRTEVFDRDGWICQLCITPIDPSLRGRQRWAASLDHIVPLSRGGLHVWANVQATHFGCNAAKSDRDVIVLPVLEVA